jgi:hypothetical protein
VTTNLRETREELAMPSESSTPTVEPARPNSGLPVVPDARSRSAAKGVATVLRRKEERRADSLAAMREQIADGTLVVRQMTSAERTGHAEAARRTATASEGNRS